MQVAQRREHLLVSWSNAPVAGIANNFKSHAVGLLQFDITAASILKSHACSTCKGRVRVF